MNNIIQIKQTQIGTDNVNSVNLRDLHKELKSKRQFTDYAKGKLRRFIENIDYICISQKSEIGNKPKIEYFVTLDTAKMIAMMENNEEGDKIRRYFIEVEKTANKPLTFEEMAKQTILIADKKIKELEATIVNKDEIILAVADLNIKAGDTSFGDFAKNLAIENLGRNNIIKFCKARGYLMSNTAPYQPYVNRGYFVRNPSKEKINGEVRHTTFLTPRGCIWLTRIIKAEFELED